MIKFFKSLTAMEIALFTLIALVTILLFVDRQMLKEQHRACVEHCKPLQIHKFDFDVMLGVSTCTCCPGERRLDRL